ncbi:MAG: hypothetical protein CO040_03285 [Candidatus Pacebacteria bacterium CG_4_9_14_0_2_um_filter_36_8]|nr:hypothetical protein [Candidatus Pacearchaeota archaeon]OIP74214.1 MAG: hypothetical protein AUK08_03145 [Candidatus Pacebacteria bacterium CG2_30_36_39]PJC42672.1 MAG: hypothetical protein CO040_03285 [Candidatus Pacebacteria bacterium CG_4_9_14_0_2_um_filter_36_8]
MRSIKQPSFKTIFVAYAWILATTGAVLISLAGVHFYYLTQKNKLANTQISDSSQTTLSDLNKPEVKGVQTIIETEDSRAELIAKFLERHNSPMMPYDYYGQKLVEIADKYNLDFRLLPAIAMRESQLCKDTHSRAPHNCLGFGIYGDLALDFDSYEAGFERAAKELRAYYINQGRTTTEEVGQKYSASDTWAEGVDQFMAELRFDDRKLGITMKKETNVLEFARGEESQ